MKNMQKGFEPVLIIIIGLFIVGMTTFLCGNIFFTNNKGLLKQTANVTSTMTTYVSEKNESSTTTTILPNSSSTTEVINILSKNFELLGESTSTSFGQVLNIASNVAERVKIRPAFLLAILQEELALEKFDMCYLTNINTGEGIRVVDGQVRKKTLKPNRDLSPFLTITKELGRDPLKTQITCPMSFGWGGAMGPADFIPSTWMLYKNQIEKITGKTADPWNINDALLASGLFLSDAGARSKTHEGEWRAAMIYFSGSPNSKYHFYADGAMEIADKIQRDIDLIQENPR